MQTAEANRNRVIGTEEVRAICDWSIGSSHNKGADVVPGGQDSETSEITRKP